MKLRDRSSWRVADIAAAAAAPASAGGGGIVVGPGVDLRNTFPVLSSIADVCETQSYIVILIRARRKELPLFFFLYLR